jgi:Zn-dependent protease
MLSKGLSLGKLFGLDIVLDISLVLVFGLVLFNLGLGVMPAWHPEWSSGLRWGVSLLAAVLLFGSILLHELSHALVGRAFGIRMRGITLFMFGGMAVLEAEPEKASAELWMAIVGPITSFAIGAVATLAGTALAGQDATLLASDALMTVRHLGPIPTLLLWLGPLNIGLALFNLLPGFPLDGGRVLRAMVWWATGDLQRATRVAATSGLGLGWLMITLGILMAFGLRVPFFGSGFGSGLWLLLLGWFLSNAASSSYGSLATKRALDRVKVADVMWTHCEVALPNESVESLVRHKLVHTDQQLFPVVQDGTLLGAVTLDKLQQVPEPERIRTPVSDLMIPARGLEVVSLDTDVTQALQLLGGVKRSEIAVVEGTELRGILRRGDVARWLSLHPSRT